MEISTLLSALSTVALIGALLFAALQVRAASRNRDEQAAIAIINTAQSDAWTRALNLLHKVPSGASASDIDALGPEMGRAIEDLGIRVETVGYMVYRRIVSLEAVDEMIGGIVIFWWQRAKPYAERDRVRTDNQKSYEWFQWLAERLAERHEHSDRQPAYLRHAAWK